MASKVRVETQRPARKKRIRFSEEIVQECLRVLTSGDPEELFEIIPRLGVLRDPRFDKCLLAFLSDKDIKKREFAACAMGAVRRHEFLQPLKEAFMEVRRKKGFGTDEFVLAVIEAIGTLGDDAAVDFFLPIVREAGQSVARERKLRKWIVESLGAIAQQGGERSVEALVGLTHHSDPEICSHALSELSVAYWHRPNEITDSILGRIYELTRDRHHSIAESALSALQSLADVGCRRAENLFTSRE